MKERFKSALYYFLFLCAAALGIMYAAFYNGYPLVTPDTGTYIDSGMNFTLPADRPPFYGAFLRISSLWTSLWFTIFIQSFIMAFLLYRLSLTIYGKKAPRYIYAVSFILIITFTSISWVSSFLMSDAFTPILFVAATLYLYSDFDRLTGAIYLILFGVSILTHNSHYIIAFLFSAYILSVALIKRSDILRKKAILLLSISIACILIIGGLNIYKKNGFTIAKGGHIFLMGKLAETGILNTYLDDKCPTINNKLCNYKKDIPIVAFVYVWDGNSPLYKIGGWDSSNKVHDPILHDVFTTPKYLKMFAIKSVISTGRQLTQVSISERPIRQDKDSNPFTGVHHYFQDEEKEYLLSKQNQVAIEVSFLNIIYYLFIALSSVFVLVYLPHMAEREKIVTVYVCIMVLIVLNAFVTATFGNVLDRLQNRISWLLPAMNAILVSKYLYEKRWPGKIIE